MRRRKEEDGVAVVGGRKKSHRRRARRGTGRSWGGGLRRERSNDRVIKISMVGDQFIKGWMDLI